MLKLSGICSLSAGGGFIDKLAVILCGPTLTTEYKLNVITHYHCVTVTLSYTFLSQKLKAVQYHDIVPLIMYKCCNDIYI